MARKTGQEAKVERITWFMMVVLFLFMTNNGVAGAWVLLSISIVLLTSGFYQWRRHWSVGPQVLICAGIGLLGGAYGLYAPVFIDLSLVALGITVVVIAFGVVANDS